MKLRLSKFTLSVILAALSTEWTAGAEYHLRSTQERNTTSNITVTSKIASENDDAEESGRGVVDVNGKHLDFGKYVSQSTNIVALRFTKLNIPDGAQILTAKIEFTAYYTSDSIPPLIHIFGQAADSAPSFAGQVENISSRTKVSSSVIWNNIGDWTVNQKYHTPNIASITQEIIDRPGWASNNPLVFILSKEDPNDSSTNDRAAYSFESNSALAPVLTIQYTLSTPSPTYTPTLAPTDAPTQMNATRSPTSPPTFANATKTPTSVDSPTTSPVTSPPGGVDSPAQQPTNLPQPSLGEPQPSADASSSNTGIIIGSLVGGSVLAGSMAFVFTVRRLRSTERNFPLRPPPSPIIGYSPPSISSTQPVIPTPPPSASHSPSFFHRGSASPSVSSEF